MLELQPPRHSWYNCLPNLALPSALHPVARDLASSLTMSALQGLANIAYFAIPVLQQVMAHVQFDDFVVAAQPCEPLQALTLLGCLASV